MLLSLAALAVLLGCSGLFDAEEPDTPQGNPVPSIMAALEAKQISPGQAQQYLWSAFLGSTAQIPASLQSSSVAPAQASTAADEAHQLMSQVFDDWDSYSGAEQWGIALSMSRLRTTMPPLKLITRNSASDGQDTRALFDYGEEHRISFCRYAEYGYDNKKLGFYDEFSADLPSCSGLSEADCGTVQTSQGQPACEFTPDMMSEDGSVIPYNRCHTRRFWDTCEPGWLEDAYADRRQELLHAAPAAYQKLGEELGWPTKTPEIARMALLHTVPAAAGSLPGATTFSIPGSTEPPYVIFQPGPFTAPACGQKSIATAVNHELFHIAQYYHRALTRSGHEEAMAEWFEDFITPTWDSEQGWFEVYAFTPGVPFDARSYDGALALRVLFRQRPDVPFALMRSRLLSGSSPVDLSEKLAALNLTEREALHTLSEQAYGMTINDLHNDTCPINYNWRTHAPTVALGSTAGEQVEYTVPGLGYEARLLEIDERVQVLNLRLQQPSTTRTSILADGGGPESERIIPLSPGDNRLCFKSASGGRHCSCADLDESELIPTHSLGLVSTQLDNDEKTVNITVDAIQYGNRASCWRMTSASMVVAGYRLYDLEEGPIVSILENPDGLPDAAPDCTAVILENHERTTYVSNVLQRPDTEIRCTIQTKTALPVEYAITTQSQTSAEGTYTIFGPRKPYQEEQAHQCTPELPGPGQFGVTDQGNAYLGILSVMLWAGDGGQAPMTFQHTIREGPDRLIMSRDGVSRDGQTIKIAAELEEVDEQQCSFAEGLLVRGLRANPSP